MKSLYLLIDLCTVIIPFVFSFHPKLQFYKVFKPFFFSNLIITIVFVLWDILFTRWGIWGFNPDYVLGIYFFNLPLEEVLFFICIPFACLFTYHCLNRFYKISWSRRAESLFVSSLSASLIITGVLFYPKLYTSSTFISLGILLLILKYLVKINWLAKVVIIYPVLLIPFFIVNGILTGTGLDAPVVWYNDAENLGIRIYSIPFEDIFYGMLLILSTIVIYEKLKEGTKTEIH